MSLQRQTSKEEKLVPDTSVIIEGVLSEEIINGSLKPREVLIHEAVLAELESQANKGRETGLAGLEELKKLRLLSEEKGYSLSFKGQRPGEFEIRHAKAGEIDSLIRRLAWEEGAVLVTADKVQAFVAESKGIKVLFYEFDEEEKEVPLNSYFDDNTMSVHLKEGCVAKAKKGTPGSWSFQAITDEPLSREYLRELSKELLEVARMRDDSFVEVEREGSTILQIGNYRIVITRPPFADGYEVTAVRPVKRLSLQDYSLSDALKERLSKHAEGILISGPPGHGKSTFAQALAVHYLNQGKVVKTVEAPRDLVLPEEVTQYSVSHGSSQEIHDILLLSRPDYTIFDEMRNTADFNLFADLRLSGVGMVGVVHATQTIDAIQRFLGRIELGVIPHVVDTVIFIEKGSVSKVYSLSMQVKVPSGMTEADLARPVVVVHDFNTGKLEFEIYSYGEETVVMPVAKDTSPLLGLASKGVEEEFSKHVNVLGVEVVSGNKAVVYVPRGAKRRLIGRGGENIERLEKRLGLSIDVREEEPSKKKRGRSVAQYVYSIGKNNITFKLDPSLANNTVSVYLDGDFLFSGIVSKKGQLKVTKRNKLGKLLVEALNEGGRVTLRLEE